MDDHQNEPVPPSSFTLAELHLNELREINARLRVAVPALVSSTAFLAGIFVTLILLALEFFRPDVSVIGVVMAVVTYAFYHVSGKKVSLNGSDKRKGRPV